MAKLNNKYIQVILPLYNLGQLVREDNVPMKKFCKQPDKRYTRKFRIYPAFLYGRLDKWLKRMSLKGLHVVDCGFFTFLFQEGAPEEKEYFTYGLTSQEGEYNLSLRHPFLEKIYGVKKKKSIINSNEKKSYEIVEIDTKRIDVKNDTGYKELVKDRNRLYLKHFLRTLSLLLVLIAVIFIVSVI